MIKKIKRIFLYITAALLCFFMTAAAASGQSAENISLFKLFQFDLEGGYFHEDSLRTDGVFIDFFLTRAGSGKNFKVKVQTDSGRVENFEPAAEIKLAPAASSDEAFLEYGGLKSIRGISFACDGPLIAAAELALNAKRFYAAIASDQALYIFAAPAKKGVKTQPVFKTYLADEPRRIYVSKDQIFILTEKYLSGFQINGGKRLNSGRRAITSETDYTPAQALKKNIKLISEPNSYNFETKYLLSDFFRFHKLVPVDSGSSENRLLAYFTGSFGHGNRNIYSLSSDFEITKVSNFSGVIADFEFADAKKPSFVIKHQKFEKAAVNPAARWIFTPPQTLSNPAGTPFEEAAPDLDSRLIAASEPTGENERLGVFIDGSLETEILKLKKMTAGNDALHINSSFQLPSAVKELNSPDFTSAISHNVKSPVFAYYAPRSSRVWLVDAIGGHIIDSIYFNQKYGQVTSMKFLGSGDILAIKTDLFEGTDFNRVGSSSLFIYRPEYRTLAEICRHKIIADYGCVRHNNGNHIIMTFGKKRSEPDSLGAINIR